MSRFFLPKRVIIYDNKATETFYNRFNYILNARDVTKIHDS